jgi:hypothetical protein
MDQDFRKIWQEQEVENMRISVEKLREQAARFQRRIRWRNLREQVAAVLVVGVFGFMAVKSPALIPKVACWLIVAAAVFIGIYIQVRGSVRSVPADLGATNCIEFHKRELARQRDLLKNIWSWYLGPFLPGFAMLVGWSILVSPPGRRWFGITYAIGAALFFWMIGWLNRKAARRLDREIQALDGELRRA